MASGIILDYDLATLGRGINPRGPKLAPITLPPSMSPVSMGNRALVRASPASPYQNGDLWTNPVSGRVGTVTGPNQILYTRGKDVAVPTSSARPSAKRGGSDFLGGVVDFAGDHLGGILSAFGYKSALESRTTKIVLGMFAVLIVGVTGKAVVDAISW